jgi:predicted glutamine amidotransferase
MCRFLLVKANTPIQPKSMLDKFADMAEKSKAPDGDWQGDGWGVAWIDEAGSWRTYTSLLPVWKDRGSFVQLPETQMFVAHARSASFPQHKGILAFNQPYISGKYAFVFNGLLRGVSLSNIPGRIGAEKIWYLIQQELKKNNPQEALETVRDLLLKNSKEIIALNIGLSTMENIYSLSYFTKFPDYYRLVNFQNQQYQAVCSEKLNW